MKNKSKQNIKKEIEKFLENKKTKDTHYFCGCVPKKDIDYKNIKEITGLISYKTIDELNKLNPYVRSITGFSYLNLPAWNFKFNVFFATKNSPEIDEVIKLSRGEIKPITTWPKVMQDTIKQGIQLIGDLLNITINYVNNLASANFVFCNYVELASLAYATFPYDLDENANIYKGKTYQFYSNNNFSNVKGGPGTLLFQTVIHEIGHTIGLGHPFDNGNQSGLMPGTAGGYFPFSNGGFFNSNTAISTVMTYRRIINEFVPIKDFPSSFVRTYQGLDLDAIKYLYNNSIQQKYIDNWIDLFCSIGVTQTIVSTEIGVNLDLLPIDFNNEKLYNLYLKSFNTNSMEVIASPWKYVSSAGIGYNPDTPIINENFSATTIFPGTKINIIFNEFNILNIYAGDIEIETTIYSIIPEGFKTFQQTVTLYLDCSEELYDVIISVPFTIVSNKQTNKKLIFRANNPDYSLTIKYGSS